MATHNYTVQAIKSAVINGDNPDTNYSSGVNADIYWGKDATRYYFYKQQLLLGFNKDALQDLAGKIITSVYLNIYTNSCNPAAEADYFETSIPMLDDFVEDEITFNSYMADRFELLDGRINVGTLPGYLRGSVPLLINDYHLGRVTASADQILGCITVKCDRTYLNAQDDPAPVIYNVDTSRGTHIPYIEITAEDSTPTVTPGKPSGTYEDNSRDITFTWEYANDSGGVQGSYELQYKDVNHSAWTALATATTADTYCVIPAGTFAAGEISWRVRVTSEYGQTSEWSNEVTFISQGAPEAPVLSVTSSPRPELSWTSIGQQAYQVRIGDTVKSPFYGTAKTYKVAEYLDDGAIVVGVRVQNSFGLWSQWSLREITITNTPGDPITLSVNASDKAQVSWTQTSHNLYYVYRDAELIAKTENCAYTDELCIGKHTYQVRGVTGDNYSMSNAATATMRTEYPEIADITDLKWISLKYATTQNRALGISVSQDVVYQYYAGRKLPVVETSGQVSRTYSFHVAFQDQETARKFEGLLGKTCVYKDQNECLIIGPLMAYEASVDVFFRAYSCSIRQTDIGEDVEYE